jgi:ATP-dependent RNA helicase RhlE
VLVATPGRLLDLVNQRAVTLNQVEVLVLDEADRMLDMGFIHDIKRVVAMLRKERQTLFFSATMPQEITKLADSMLNDPVRVSVTPQATTVERIAQRVIHTEKSAKPSLLIAVLKSETTDRVLVFTRTKHGADKVVKGLEKNGFLSAAIHGNKSQNQRERVLADFKSGKLRILIATDIAARGIDVDGVSHVINFDLPNVPESYVHRIGRTARAGADGIAISFCDQEEGVFLRDIERMIRMTIPASGEKQPHRPAVRNSGNRGQGGRPQHAGGGRDQRGNNRGGNGGGNGRHGGHRSHGGGNGGNGHQGRPSQAGHQNNHAQAPRQEASSGEPNGIGTVTFLQRSGEPRRNAGHRTHRT